MKKAISIIILSIAALGIGVILIISQTAQPTQTVFSGSASGGGKVLPTALPKYQGTPTKRNHPTSLPYTTCPGPIPTMGVAPTPTQGVILGTPMNYPYNMINGAAGMVSGGNVYLITTGELKANNKQGVITVQLEEIDMCKDMANNITPIPTAEVLEPGLHGGITTTGISGAVISFRAADGTTGHFNYVTVTFMP